MCTHIPPSKSHRNSRRLVDESSRNFIRRKKSVSIATSLDWTVTMWIGIVLKNPLIALHPSVLLHCWLGHLTCKIVSEMTYNASSGTLNGKPYNTCWTFSEDQSVDSRGNNANVRIFACVHPPTFCKLPTTPQWFIALKVHEILKRYRGYIQSFWVVIGLATFPTFAKMRAQTMKAFHANLSLFHATKLVAMAMSLDRISPNV